MQLPKGFKVREGAELQGPLPRLVVKIQAFLDSTKFQEVMTTFQLAQGTSYTPGTVRSEGAHPALELYRYKTPSGTILWGSKRTIAELRKQLKKQSEQA